MENRKNETTQIGVLLEEILAELRKGNQRVDLLENQVKALQERENIVSCTEAAAELNVSRQTISAYIRQGKLQKVARNGRVGILRSSLIGL